MGNFLLLHGIRQIKDGGEDKKERTVSWNLNGKEGGEKVYRNYYLYDTEELISELENVGFKIVKRNFGTGRNIIIIVSKD